MKRGTQILYIPNHAKGEFNHQDIEEGFVTSHTSKKDFVFCRYWSKSYPGELRTKSCSEATPLGNLLIKNTRPQRVVEELLKELP